MSDQRSHTHSSPVELASVLGFASLEEANRCFRAARRCPECGVALLTLESWLVALGHWDPKVGPEFLTRHGLFAELFEPHESHGERLERVDQDSLFHHWGLCRLLLDSSLQASSNLFALEMLELADASAAQLDPELYGKAWISDLRASIAAQTARVYFHLDEIGTAKVASRLARDYLAEGTGRSREAIARTRIESEALGDPTNEQSPWYWYSLALEDSSEPKRPRAFEHA